MSYLKSDETDKSWFIILSLLLLNPVVIFLLTKSLLLAVSLVIIAFLILVKLNTLSDTLNIFGVNFLVLFSILLHAELVFKFGFPELIIENLYHIEDGYYFNNPYLVKEIEDKEYHVTYKTNADGYRMPEALDQEKKIKKCDWLFIGDSFTQGAQVEFKDLYTSQLYTNFPDKVIVNAGISGFGIAQELAYYRNKGAKLKPKKVILQLCSFNDFMNVMPEGNQFSDYLMERSDLARSILYNIKFKAPGELPLGRWTEPFCAKKSDNEDYNIFYKNKSPKQKKDIALVKEYISQFKKEVEKNGSELLIFLIPTKEQSYARYLNEVLDEFSIKQEEVDMEYPNKLLFDITDSLGIILIDCLDDFKNNDENIFYEYDEHLNEYGHYVTANLLAKYLKDSTTNNTTLISQNLLGERYPSCTNGNVLYQGLRDGNMELFLKDMNGEEQRLTYNNLDDTHPTFSNSLNLVAFTEGDAAQQNTKVGLLNLATMEKSYLSNNTETYSAIPQFSPDGMWLTYAEWKVDKQTHELTNPRIVIHSTRDPESKRYLTNGNSESWRPTFSPDGQSIVYISKDEESFDIYLKNLVTESITKLTDTPFNEWDPIFSPNSEQIIYAAFKNKNWDLFQLDITNKEIVQLTNTLGDEWDPNFCDDETDIIYAGEFGFYNCIYKKRL